MVKIQWSYNWCNLVLNQGMVHVMLFLLNILLLVKKKPMRLYFAFIYFKKAFDRRLLCLNFSKVAIEGKSLEVIKAFYRHVKFCIGVEGFLSEYFFDNLGLMQGEMLSPIPFNLYVNDFENSFLNACCFFLRLILLNSIYIRF